jgi:ring-1,2-phenylacetyl-CoA epoxidase subunit PaaE
MDLLQFKVIDVIPENGMAVRIRMERTDGRRLLYEAGQFLTLILQRGESDLRRSYSFSSSPESEALPEITVKRQVNGQVSRWLVDHVHPGVLLFALAPAGRFTVQTNPSECRQFFFIAAGSGITPVFSLLKKILLEEPRSEAILIYQNRDEGEILFDSQLKTLKMTYSGRFRWTNLLSRPKNPGQKPERLNNFRLESWVRSEIREDKDVSFYLCGPSALMRMAQFTLRLMGFSEEQIRKENFTVDFLPPPPPISSGDPRQVIIHRNHEVHQIQVSFPTNILQAALDHQIPLPYSCRGGRCSTCAAKLLNGKVKMSINEVLTQRDLDQGWILTCVGYAETDIEIQF